MEKLLFAKSQIKLFNKCRDDNNEQYFRWRLMNFYVPIIIILVPLSLYFFIPEDGRFFQNLILNGSFSLLGINALFGTSIFLINSYSLKGIKLEKDILNIRFRLVLYLGILLILGSILYVLQISFKLNSEGQIFTVLFGLLFVLYLSFDIASKNFLIQDEIVGQSFDKDIEENVENLQNAVDDF